MFLDNDQLVHLQAMANAQAHFVVQQGGNNVPSEGQTDDQQEQPNQYYNSYLPENYQQYPYFQGLTQEEMAQYAAQDFPVFRGQMFTHQGAVEAEGGNAIPDASAVGANNNSGDVPPIVTNAMVSSPSVEEEIAKLQIVDSDSDEPKHRKADITAAATSSYTNDSPENNTAIAQADTHFHLRDESTNKHSDIQE